MAGPAQVEIEIVTQSSPIPNWQDMPAPAPPKITLNGEPLSAPTNGPAWTPNGCQVVVFSSSEDLTQPSSIISNLYQQVANMQGNWSESYRWMYDNIATQIMSSGDVEQQIVLVATFGLDVEMLPTAAPFELFLNLGSGKQLQEWGLVPSISEGGYYIEYPANYALIGNSAYGYGEGFEQCDYTTTDSSDTITTTLTATIDNPGGS
jgi:hypothetical protein